MWGCEGGVERRRFYFFSCHSSSVKNGSTLPKSKAEVNFRTPSLRIGKERNIRGEYFVEGWKREKHKGVLTWCNTFEQNIHE